MQAGVAKREITTEEKGVAIRDPLYAKALVLHDGATRAAILALDALAIGGIGDIGDDFLPQLRARIEEELQIPARNILVNASHTHPPGRILCESGELLDRTFDTVKSASETLLPVKVGVGAGREERVAMNRNLTLKNGRHWTIRHANPCPPDEEVVSIGPLDSEIGVLRVDRLDGTPLAVVYNFACHLLFGDPQNSVTANLPGVASQLIEETLGHGALALFLQGAAGDVIDVGFKNFDAPRDIEPLGLLLGRSTLQAARAVQTGEAELSIIAETVELPRRTDIPARIAALRKEQGELLASLRGTTLNFKSFLPLYLQYSLHPRFPADYAHAYLQAEKRGDAAPGAMDDFKRGLIEKYLANIGAMEKLARIEDEIATHERHQAINDEAGEPNAGAEVLGLRIGDCALISAPIELLTEIGLNLKAASPHEHTLVAAFSNGYMHYGPPAADYDKGGYEVIECFLAPEWEAIYMAKATDILQRLALA